MLKTVHLYQRVIALLTCASLLDRIQSQLNPFSILLHHYDPREYFPDICTQLFLLWFVNEILYDFIAGMHFGDRVILSKLYLFYG